MSNRAIQVSPQAFHTIMLGLTKALLLVDDDIPAPADVLIIGMHTEPKIRPFLQVRITSVEEFDLEEGPWAFVLNNMAPERVALVSFNMGLSLE